MFSKELKEATKESHSAAENTKFVAGFLRGVVDPEEYRKLIANFWYVYSTMERLINDSEDPTVRILQGWQSELDRSQSLEKDLVYYYGPYWKEKIESSPACDTYCSRLTELAQEDPYLLLAHHYTRYIGDLSGGQILCKIAKSALNPPAGEGLNFYEFPEIHDAKEWKTTYRAVLDQLDLDQSQKNAVFVEANHAFKLNMYMFDEIKSEDPYPVMTALYGFWKVITGSITNKGK
jgi:heme oxygenase